MPVNMPDASAPQPPMLLDQVRKVIRLRGLTYRTEQTYIDWIKRFIFYHQKRHPREMGAAEIHAFLAHLVLERNVVPSTQNQALHALLFLYQQVLEMELPYVGPVGRGKKEEPPPREVLTREEVNVVLSHLSGTKWLMASLLYGSGLRLTEWLRLRVKDLDFGNDLIIIHEGKGMKDRVTMLPEKLKEPLREHFI